jgi:hypothetical protein
MPELLVRKVSGWIVLGVGGAFGGHVLVGKVSPYFELA